MKKFSPFFLFALFPLLISAQQDTLYFSEAVSLYIPKHNKEINEAYRYRDSERAKFLFDSLVNNCLKGTYIDNFNITCLRRNNDCLNDYKKPIYLLTYASWCVPGKGEIPALNELAEKYKEEIDFVVLYWDSKAEVKKVAKEYTRSIHLVYVDELQNKDAYIVRNMKHSLGFPTTFYIGSNKQIIDISRIEMLPYTEKFERSYNLNYKNVSQGISEILAFEEDLLAKTPFEILPN
ncbi:TlpA family protein disulfide reductase [Mesonia maritima]|uniref:Thiol-disulfide isomerase/thioredoxin n=1 Tax=Mesonia maritima TaxID=1793873 RepID=A0ABU1K579_9FLAO|nr:redoxin domain-containing protein [Mesonia maritima]MDR6300770.1 thiol-disulfide isomerase/thioredoxin [Mesonia maritima]